MKVAVVYEEYYLPFEFTTNITDDINRENIVELTRDERDALTNLMSTRDALNVSIRQLLRGKKA